MFWFLCLATAVIFIRWRWKKIKGWMRQRTLDKLNRVETEIETIQREMWEMYEKEDESLRPAIEKHNRRRVMLEHRSQYLKKKLV